MDRRTGDEVQRPFVADDVWSGFISCGVNVAQVVQEDPCTEDPNQDTEHRRNVTAGLRTFFLYVDWESELPGSGEELSVSVSAGEYEFENVSGESPLTLRIDNDEIRDPAMQFENIDGQRELSISVLPGGEVLGAALQQEFRVIILEFHWRAAQEGFQFTVE